MAMVELKPCPFCGGVDEHLVETFMRASSEVMWWAVECQNCSAEVGSGEGEGHARDLWNTRHDPYHVAAVAAGYTDVGEALKAIPVKDAALKNCRLRLPLMADHRNAADMKLIADVRLALGDPA